LSTDSGLTNLAFTDVAAICVTTREGVAVTRFGASAVVNARAIGGGRCIKTRELEARGHQRSGIN
jgi:hypothetical protein